MKRRLWSAALAIVLLGSAAANGATGNAHASDSREMKLYRFLNSAWLLQHYSSKQQETIRKISHDAAYVWSDPRRSQQRFKSLSASKQDNLLRALADPAFTTTAITECTDPPPGTKICDLPPYPDCNLDGADNTVAQVAASCGYMGAPAAGADDGMGEDVDYDPQYPTSTTGGPEDAAPIRGIGNPELSLTGSKRKVNCLHITPFFIPMAALCGKTNWQWHTPQVTYCVDSGAGHYAVFPYTVTDVNGSNVSFTPANGSCIHTTTATVALITDKLPVISKGWTIRQTLGNNGSSFWEGS